VIVVRVTEDFNKGITNPNGVLSGITVRLVIRTDQDLQHGTVSLQMCHMLSYFKG
jgi:hypothetical protein